MTVDLRGKTRALLSVVLFQNWRMRLAAYPSPSFSMLQINYRTYVIDRETGERAIWFLGTLLGSWTYVVPRYLWQMPWRKGDIRLRYKQEAVTGRYVDYRVEADHSWAPLRVHLVQSDDKPLDLPGFSDVGHGLALLTHTFAGYYRRRDGAIGVNRVWHGPIPVKPARLLSASIGLLAREGWVHPSEQAFPHSVLIAPRVEFLSFLPPHVVDRS